MFTGRLGALQSLPLIVLIAFIESEALVHVFRRFRGDFIEIWLKDTLVGLIGWWAGVGVLHFTTGLAGRVAFFFSLFTAIYGGAIGLLFYFASAVNRDRPTNQ